MDDPGKLVVGGVYFTIDYFDDALRLPCLQSYVYLGHGLLPGGTADDHYFQTVESYFSQGNWRDFAPDARGVLNENAVIIYGSENLGLVSEVDELIEALKTWSRRSLRQAGS
jgi:hypothetical protein